MYSPSPRSARLSLLLPAGLLVAALGLSACAPVTYESPQNGVELNRIEALADFHFRHGASSLSGAQQDRLRSFLHQRKVTAEDRLVISLPPATTPAITAAREAHLRRLVAPWGAGVRIVGEPPAAKVTTGRDRGLIRLMRASHMKVYCQSEDNVALRCAQRRNLAEMLAEPNDLVQPRVFGGPFRPRPAKEAAADTALPAAGTTSMGG